MVIDVQAFSGIISDSNFVGRFVCMLKKEIKKKEGTGRRGISLKAIGLIIAGTATVLTAALMTSIFLLTSRYRQVMDSTNAYIEYKSYAQEVQVASDYLTEQVRSYVVTGEDEYYQNYFVEADSKRRENALQAIESYFEDHAITKHLEDAVNESIKLMDKEYYAMRLVMEAKGTDISQADIPEAIKNVELYEMDSLSTPEAKMDAATEAVFGVEYNQAKGIISGNIKSAVGLLDGKLEENVVQSTGALKAIITVQQVAILVNVVFIFLCVVGLFVFLIRPVRDAVKKLNAREKVEVRGSKEYRYLAEAYNHFYDLNATAQERLAFEAEHDRLTSLYNRTGYDKIYGQAKLDKCVYVLLDIDQFKAINDSFGHASGDAVLVRVGKALTKYFHSSNANVFRIGGDEFAVLLENVNGSYEKAIIEKCNSVNKELEKAFDDFATSMSFGVAYGEENDNTDTLFKRADYALYQAKSTSKGNISFFKESGGAA